MKLVNFNWNADQIDTKDFGNWTIAKFYLPNDEFNERIIGTMKYGLYTSFSRVQLK